LADVIVVDGNPLEDIAVLQNPNNIAIVLQAGHLVKGEGYGYRTSVGVVEPGRGIG
jgi:imidazolonepropionase-like amidohydrolase